VGLPRWNSSVGRPTSDLTEPARRRNTHAQTPPTPSRATSRRPRKAIKDSVHDHITLGPVAADLIDTPVFQCLRHIKQLSTVRLVYPSGS
jgi:hypothetical protein